MKWTEAQSRTINTRNKNILVSAAAGSGKTAVLIERIKELIIKDKVDIDRFLITTFTNAASKEMKERLTKVIKKELQDENADIPFLKKQLRLMTKANISTFHSFAIEVIKENFHLTELEPGFKIGDEIEIALLKNESIDDVFELKFSNEYMEFKSFLEKYSDNKNEDKIKEGIVALYNEMRSIPYYIEWAKQKNELLNNEDPIKNSGITEYIIEDMLVKFELVKGYFEEAYNIILDNEIKSLEDKALDDLEKIEEIFQSIKNIANTSNESSGEDIFNTLSKLIEEITYNTMRASKDDAELYAEIKDRFAKYRQNGKNEIKSIKDKYFNSTYNQYSLELREVYSDTKYLLEIIKDFEDEFIKKKKDLSVIDFDDTMHYAIEILNNDDVANQYKEKFEHILIDEFQDSNMLQELIIGRICRGNNLFMVGDIKQSIYKFRLAEPEIFKRKYELYKSDKEIESEKIDLNSNFRSKKNVTKTVNNIFDRIMDDYDENARLHCGSGDIAGYDSRLTIIEKGNSEDKFLLTQEYEIPVIIDKINENLGKQIYDIKSGSERPIEFQDIIVLVRNNSSISIIEKELNNNGIPAFGEDTNGYYETVEVSIFINLLKIIDNTSIDLPLISVMRSIIFDFTDEDLAKIRVNNIKGSFEGAVRKYIETGKDKDIKKKISEMYERLEYWKAIKMTISLEELIRKLLYDTGYINYCSALPAGKQRTANLRFLIEKAIEFEKNNYSGLYGFLRYVDDMDKNNLSVGETKMVGENENLVKIMTIHKSKGLEYPVVILVGAGREIKMKPAKTFGVMHKKFGIGISYINLIEQWRKKTILQNVILEEKKNEALDEEVRVLYVALTRAKDRLEIIGTIDSIDKLDETRIGKTRYLDMVYPPFIDSDEDIDINNEDVDTLHNTNYIKKITNIKSLMLEMDIAGKGEEYKAIENRLTFEYGDPDALKVKSKYSVSELNAKSKQIPMLRTIFDEHQNKLSPAQIGTAIHLVMEKLNFNKAFTFGKDYIIEIIDKLKTSGQISDEAASQIDIAAILDFFKTEIGIRAAKSKKIIKEQEIIFRKKIGVADTIVQGVIDCYFEDDDGIVLIDYKNIYAEGTEDESQIIDKYKKQIELYKDGLEKSLNKNVKGAYLYLFKSKKFIRII